MGGRGVNASFVKADRDRGFADWGVTVVLRRVSQSYDPETGELSETYFDRSLRAIAGENGVGAAAGTAGQAGDTQQVFAVRSEEVEGENNLRTMRIVHEGREYRIHDVESQLPSRVTVLRCGAV